MHPDPRAIRTKTILIDGKEYLVSVMPPGPELHDETVWKFPKAGAHHGILRRVATPDGLEDLITTYDREETVDESVHP